DLRFRKGVLMSYLQLFIVALMWSFVGVMVKSASGMVSSSVITLCRFLFGCGFLVLFLGSQRLFKKQSQPLRLFWKDKWVWIGVAGKSCNYIFENLAISLGHAYTNVIVWPVQAIFLTFVAVLVLGEEMDFQKAGAVILCVIGVLLVSWKGLPLSQFFGANLTPTIFVIFSAIGSGVHLISQKKLIGYLDSVNLNFSVFFLSSLLMAIPLPWTFKFTGTVYPWALISLAGLGIVTGASFYLYAEALKKVPFLVATIITNSCVLFTLLWSYLFFKDKINGYIIIGVVILLAGLIIINLPKEFVATLGWKQGKQKGTESL
ncbi:MAG TPA: DMT family transporter, partial [Bacillota bacterium]|nr:DMT family transporter [Bacillota bacterium]